MKAEDMLRVWAAKKLDLPIDRVESVRFEHGDAWTSESGTGYPEENYAYATIFTYGVNNPRRDSVWLGDFGGAEAIPGLLQEIMDACGDQTELPRPC